MDPGVSLRLRIDVDIQSNGRAAGFNLHQGRRIDVLVFQGDESQDIGKLALLQHCQKLGEECAVLLDVQDEGGVRTVGVRVGELVRGKALFDEAPSSRDDVGEIRVSGSMPRNGAVSKLDQDLGRREVKMVVEKNDSQLLVHAMLDEDAADDRLQGLDGSGWLRMALRCDRPAGPEAGCRSAWGYTRAKQQPFCGISDLGVGVEGGDPAPAAAIWSLAGMNRPGITPSPTPDTRRTQR
ncbi:hypothetical protein MKZ38_009778 [Zalerion maritima]|uniref:Uncharacterized protein n=1 Tax=Zalerion maritima TaxID=339359 RepID=A0AAD5RZS0_9PEZI|nr:hypothetical protein MKZ38_009778 [Zalerion maritima]